MRKLGFFSKINKKLLFFNLFFLQIYLLRFQIGPLPTNMQEILIGLQGIAFLASIIQEKKAVKIIENIRKHWVIIGFGILTLISIFTVKIVERIDFIRHLKFTYLAIIFVFIFLETFKEKRERENAVKIMGFGAIAFGIFSIIFNLLGYNIAHDLRLLGPLDAAVYLAYYLVPFFIFFSIKFISKTKQKDNLIFAIILGLLIIATRSMGAIGGSFLILTIFIVQRHRKTLLKGKIRKTALALAIITISVVIFYSKVLPTLKTDYSSLDERGEIWRTSMQLLKEPKHIVFGVGFGQFQQHYVENVEQALGQKPLDYFVLQPHNIFLLFIFHYGIFGLIFLLFLMYEITRNIIKTDSKTDIQIISSYIVLYFFIHGLIDTPFFKNDMLILLILFLEMGFPYPKPATKSIKTE